MSVRPLCLTLAGAIVAWTIFAATQTGAVAQTGPQGSLSDDRYLPDLAQSYVQDLDAPDAAAISDSTISDSPISDLAGTPDPILDEPSRATALYNCQDYQVPVIADGQARAAYGTACQKTDGSWQVVSAPSLTSERASTSRPSGICREFQQRNLAIADADHAYGTACQDRDGVWRFTADSGRESASDARGVCQTYEQDIIDDGRPRVAHGTACEQLDGSWRIVTAPVINSQMRVASREPMQEMPRSRRSSDDFAAWEEITPTRRTVSPPSFSGQDYREPSRPSERRYAEDRSSLAETLDRATSALMAPFRGPTYRPDRAPPRRYYPEPRSYRYYP